MAPTNTYINTYYHFNHQVAEPSELGAELPMFVYIWKFKAFAPNI